MKTNTLKDRHVAVLGMGISGQATARWLRAMGADLICYDAKPLVKWPERLRSWCEDEGIQVVDDNGLDKLSRKADLAVVSPGIRPDSFLIKRIQKTRIDIIGELALAAAFWKGPIVAITGTNGKTTTTSLISHMLRQTRSRIVTGGNIAPPLATLMEDNTEDTTAVLEISSFQLEYLPASWHFPFARPRFNVAAWLNLAPDHLDRHKDLKTYGDVKARLLRYQGPEDWTLLNLNDPTSANWHCANRSRKLYFGTCSHGRPGAFIDRHHDQIRVIWPGNEHECYSLRHWTLQGLHNLENLACAILAARLAGAGPRAVQGAMDTFKAPSHRFELVCERDGIQYIDDSKATNVAASLRALEALKGPGIFIMGGQGKNEDYSVLKRAIADMCSQGKKNGKGRWIKAVVLMGTEATALEEALKDVVNVVGIFNGDNGEKAMRGAVELAASVAKRGDTVVLSPACASFDMFQDYKERGLFFQRAIKDLFRDMHP